MKMYCIFSREAIAKMGGNRGKLAVQAGHAFLHAYWDALTRFPATANLYRTSEMAKKVTLIVNTDDELKEIYENYIAHTGATIVRDRGLTVFAEPTLTCVGIGPINEEDVQEDLKSIKVLI